MGFGNNSTLIKSANVIDVVADAGVESTYFGTAGADAFVIANGDVGDDDLVGFAKNDSLITHKKIFDGNNDGYIAFGPNGELDVDRTSAKSAGSDQINVAGAGGEVDLLRYLGTKGDGNFVYADASVRDNLLGSFSAKTGVSQLADSSITQTSKFESAVSGDAFDASTSATAILFDNALGLNLGSDTVKGFGNDDLLIFTSKIYNKDGNPDIITFGTNDVLDLSGAFGPQASDPAGGPGGQLKLITPTQTAIEYLGEKTIEDVTYYYYGHVGTSLAPDGVGLA